MKKFERNLALRCADLARSAGHFAGEVAILNEAPLPVARSLRTGLSIGAGFVGFALTRHFESAVICAIFTNLLIFVDQLAPLRERLWVLGVAALTFAAAGAVGGIIAGVEPVVLLATFAFASFAGLVQGSLPGVELIPRNSLICMVVGAYLPHIDRDIGLGVAAGAMLALLGAYLEHRFAPNERGPALATARELVAYQHPSFVSVYGAAAVGGMALGYFTGDVKPYWVTITTLVVMQPGRRANAVRATQRFIGTMTGVVVAYLFSLSVGHWQREIFLAFAVATPFLWPLAFGRNYGLGVAVLSFWILVLLDLALPPQQDPGALFFARLMDTAIGCALALTANFVVEERSRHQAA